MRETKRKLSIFATQHKTICHKDSFANSTNSGTSESWRLGWRGNGSSCRKLRQMALYHRHSSPKSSESYQTLCHYVVHFLCHVTHHVLTAFVGLHWSFWILCQTCPTWPTYLENADAREKIVLCQKYINYLCIINTTLFTMPSIISEPISLNPVPILSELLIITK